MTVYHGHMPSNLLNIAHRYFPEQVNIGFAPVKEFSVRLIGVDGEEVLKHTFDPQTLIKDTYDMVVNVPIAKVVFERNKNNHAVEVEAIIFADKHIPQEFPAKLSLGVKGMGTQLFVEDATKILLLEKSVKSYFVLSVETNEYYCDVLTNLDIITRIHTVRLATSKVLTGSHIIDMRKRAREMFNKGQLPFTVKTMLDSLTDCELELDKPIGNSQVILSGDTLLHDDYSELYYALKFFARFINDSLEEISKVIIEREPTT